MFNRLAELKTHTYAPIPVLDEDCVCDDFHPDIFELAILKKSAFTE